jgi:polygalacturonase
MTNETGVIGSTNASLVSYTAGFAGAVAQTVQTKLEQYVSVKDFGAVGDGVANDTVAIQAALNSGATVIQGVPGETYLVSASGTVSVNSVAFSYCLLVSNGTTFDLNYSTVKQANAQNSSVIALNGLTDAGVINGTVDSNETNQTTPATGSMAGVLIHNCTRPKIEILPLSTVVSTLVGF